MGDTSPSGCMVSVTLCVHVGLSVYCVTHRDLSLYTKEDRSVCQRQTITGHTHTHTHAHSHTQSLETAGEKRGVENENNSEKLGTEKSKDDFF